MFLNFIHGLKKGGSLFALVATITSATAGASCFLFKKADNREKIKTLYEDLEKAKEGFGAEIIKTKVQNFAKKAPLIEEKSRLKKLTTCIRKEMEKHDESYTFLGSIYITDIDKCKEESSYSGKADSN